MHKKCENLDSAIAPLRSRIKDFFANNYPDINLSAGISQQLSSIETVETFLLLEEAFDFRMDAFDFDPEVLADLDSLEFFLKRKNPKLS